MKRQRRLYFLQCIGPVEERRKRAAKAKKKAPARGIQWTLPQLWRIWPPTVSVPGVDQGVEDLEEEVQQSGSVWTVRYGEGKAPVKVPSRFAILEDEDLEFEAPSGLEVRKTAAPLLKEIPTLKIVGQKIVRWQRTARKWATAAARR